MLTCRQHEVRLRTQRAKTSQNASPSSSCALSAFSSYLLSSSLGRSSQMHVFASFPSLGASTSFPQKAQWLLNFSGRTSPFHLPLSIQEADHHLGLVTTALVQQHCLPESGQPPQHTTAGLGSSSQDGFQRMEPPAFRLCALPWRGIRADLAFTFG